MVEIYDELGGKAFLEAARRCCEMNVIGLLVCWAHQFSGDMKQFLTNLESSDLEMIRYVNEQAQFYECFSGNPKVERARLKGDADGKTKVEENEKRKSDVGSVSSDSSPGMRMTMGSLEMKLVLVGLLSFMILALAIWIQM